MISRKSRAKEKQKEIWLMKWKYEHPEHTKCALSWKSEQKCQLIVQPLFLSSSLDFLIILNVKDITFLKRSLHCTPEQDFSSMFIIYGMFSILFWFDTHIYIHIKHVFYSSQYVRRENLQVIKTTHKKQWQYFTCLIYK